MARKGTGRGFGRRVLGVESLESRAMLAGNVSVSLAGGNLLVRGDGQANEIAIVQLSSGQYAVAGLPGTTVQGSTEPWVVNGVKGNIDVDLKGGNDLVGVGNDVQALVDKADSYGLVDGSSLSSFISDLDSITSGEQLVVPKSLLIRTGDGNDGVAVIADVNKLLNVNLGGGDNIVDIDPTFIGESCIVRGGNGDDLASVFETQINKVLDIYLGKGDNSVYIDDSSVGLSAIIGTCSGDDEIDLGNLVVGKSLIINTDGGTDTVYAHDHGNGGVEVGVNAIINTGSGSDYAEFEGEVEKLLHILTCSGDDGVGVFNSTVGTLIVDVGTGNDSDVLRGGDVGLFGDDGGVDLFEVVVRGNLFVFLGTGHDTLFAESITVGRDALVNAGTGDDAVEIVDSIVANLFQALMCAGNDTLTATNSAAKKVIANGGSGFDTLNTDIDPNNPPAGVKVIVVLFDDINVNP